MFDPQPEDRAMAAMVCQAGPRLPRSGAYPLLITMCEKWLKAEPTSRGIKSMSVLA